MILLYYKTYLNSGQDALGRTSTRRQARSPAGRQTAGTTIQPQHTEKRQKGKKGSNVTAQCPVRQQPHRSPCRLRRQVRGTRDVRGRIGASLSLKKKIIYI